MNLYSDTFDFEKFYLETKDDDMYCIVFNLIEDIQCLKEALAKHDAEVIEQFIKEIDDLGFVVETGEFSSAWVIDVEEIKGYAQLRQKAKESE